MEEIWKDVVGYEGLYKVSSFGRVWSIKKECEIKEIIGSCGYPQVTLYHKDIKRRTLLIHRVVAMAFIENSLNKPYVNHIDGDKLNNYVENLEWCTQKENIHHAIKQGLSPQFKVKNVDGLKLGDNPIKEYKGKNKDYLKNENCKGEKNINSKLNWELVREIRNSELSTNDLLEKYKVSKSTISKIKNNICWKE